MQQPTRRRERFSTWRRPEFVMTHLSDHRCCSKLRMRSVGWLSLSHRCSWKDYPVPPPREWLLEARESRLRHSFLRCSWSPSTSSPISQYLSFVGGGQIGRAHV